MRCAGSQFVVEFVVVRCVYHWHEEEGQPPAWEMPLGGVARSISVFPAARRAREIGTVSVP